MQRWLKKKEVRLIAFSLMFFACLIALFTYFSRAESEILADIVAPLGKAEVARFKFTVAEWREIPNTREVTLMGATRQRDILSDGRIRIQDDTNNRCLLLDPKTQLAEFVPVDSVDSILTPRVLFERVARMRHAAEGGGARAIGAEGDTVGFHVQEEGVQWLVWADSFTHAIRSIEVIRRKPVASRTTIFDLQLDPDVDEADFSLNLPPGYRLRGEPATQDPHRVSSLSQ